MTARRPVIAVLLAAACAPVVLVPRSPADDGHKDAITKRLNDWNTDANLRRFATVPPPAATSSATPPARIDTPPAPGGRGTVRMLCFAVNMFNTRSPGYRGMSANTLVAPTKDIDAYEAAGRRLGYSVRSFKNDQVTADLVLRELSAATAARAGDTVIVAYAGHGSQMRDLNGDENGGQDSTWCLYDRMLIDDELGEAWTKFAEGVTIVVIADSCHSGTSSRAVGRARNQGQQENSAGARALANRGVAEDNGEEVRVRTLLADDAKIASDNHERAFGATFAATRGSGQTAEATKATVLTLAACQDEQTSLEDSQHGRFTRHVLAIAGDGRYTGTYLELVAEAARRIRDPNQIPKVTAFGGQSQNILTSRPFN